MAAQDDGRILAVPEWAPGDESHLVGSLSAVTKIAYGKGSVTYSTFDQESTDVLRLDFVPDSITIGGKAISRRKELTEQGYTFDDRLTCCISGTQLPETWTFKERVIEFRPPTSLSTILIFRRERSHRPIPSGVIDWGKGDWEIGTPHGKFATFTLVLADPKARQADFHFYMPLIFSGIDVYNDGDTEATVTVRSPEIREMSFSIKPKELRR